MTAATLPRPRPVPADAAADRGHHWYTRSADHHLAAYCRTPHDDDRGHAEMAAADYRRAAQLAGRV